MRAGRRIRRKGCRPGWGPVPRPRAEARAPMRDQGDKGGRRRMAAARQRRAKGEDLVQARVDPQRHDRALGRKTQVERPADGARDGVLLRPRDKAVK